MSLNHEMAAKHEADIAAEFEGRQSRGSGNQWRNPMDGRHSRYAQTFAWAWDCKATRSKSMSITRDMLAKAVEQADGERPMVPIRFYDDDRLRSFDDWILVRKDDLREVLDAQAH